MNNETDILLWLQQWYNNNCNGDWEHGYGIKIGNLDNPGWCVDIDLIDTKYENIEIAWVENKTSYQNWCDYHVKDKKFEGYGDPFKLQTILEKFREIIEEADKK